MKSPRDLVFYALLLAVLLGVKLYQSRDAASGPAPPLSGTTIDGQPFDLAQPRGKPTLVYFWATWCGVCKAMQHNIDALGGDTPMITVALQSGDSKEVSRFLRERGISMPVLLDEEGEAAARFGIRGVPAAFVLDSDGVIRSSTQGYSTELGLRLRLWLARD